MNTYIELHIFIFLLNKTTKGLWHSRQWGSCLFQLNPLISWRCLSRKQKHPKTAVYYFGGAVILQDNCAKKNETRDFGTNLPQD